MRTSARSPSGQFLGASDRGTAVAPVETDACEYDMSDEANLEELALLLDEFIRELEHTIDTQRRKEIATEVSELTLRLHTLREREPQKS